MSHAALAAYELLVPRQTRLIDLDAVPGLVMSARPKKHKISELDGAFISCHCGWHYREHKHAEYAAQALADHLLDHYNTHRAAAAQRGEQEENES